MSLLSRLRGAFRAQPKAAHDASNLTIEELAAMYEVGVTRTGLRSISERTAMQSSTVYACVALIAGKVGSLPIDIVERTPKGPQVLGEPHDYWWLLNERPHPELSATTFWRYITESMMLTGDGFAEIRRPSYSSSRVSDLLPLHPRRVDPFRDSGGRLWYRVTPEFGPQYVRDPSDILHFATGFGFDGLRSISPVRYAGQTAIGLDLAAAEHSARFFGNDARPDLALSTEGSLNPEQIKQLRTMWMQFLGREGSRLPAVLQGGLKLEKITMSAEDAELIATRGFQVAELARIWGVPPHMIGHTEKSTSWGTGIAAQSAGFVRYTLDNYTDPIETELNFKLWPLRSRYFVRHNTDELEKADIKARYEAHRAALGRAGERSFMTLNEVRRAERLPTVEGGDELDMGSGDPPADEGRSDRGNDDDQESTDRAARE